MNKSEIRKAYFLNKYAIITPVRSKRPHLNSIREIIDNNAAGCPFCPSNIDRKNIIDKIGSGNNWKVLCLKNIFPAVALDNSKAYGTQEVIIETPVHNQALGELDKAGIKNVLAMHIKRTSAAARKKNIDYILCFKNQGSKAGASMPHAHSQIFASSLLPPDIKEELDLAYEYKRKNKTCPYCDIIKKENKSKRLIWADKNVIAFAPYASEYHYEAWIFTRRHLDNITRLNEPELESFSAVLKKILVKLKALNLSYNFFMHQVISDKNQHFYLKLQPRESIWAGIELGSGLVINSVPPEDAAAFYRK